MGPLSSSCSAQLPRQNPAPVVGFLEIGDIGALAEPPGPRRPATQSQCDVDHTWVAPGSAMGSPDGETTAQPSLKPEATLAWRAKQHPKLKIIQQCSSCAELRGISLGKIGRAARSMKRPLSSMRINADMSVRCSTLLERLDPNRDRCACVSRLSGIATT